MRALAAIILALSVSACEGELEPFHGDVTFTAPERTTIEAGLGFIYEHRNPDERRRIAWDLPHPDGALASSLSIVRAPPGHPIRGAAVPNQVGERTGETGAVWLDPAFLETPVLPAHEFGHVYGCRHHDGRGIMNPIPDREDLTWTEADAASCG